ncbi:MAG: prolipoprotein diacylglyceryl transferase [Ruminococcaceae bacterium]|nr:prolipoprotein diacylglyceryl transferase [Oscillospiraceae bacterium]
MNSETVVVRFEGLGLPEITLNKVAFTLFDTIQVRWYGIFITLGIVCAFLYAYYRSKKTEDVILDDLLDVGIWTVILGVVGARLYYVLTSLERFPTFWSVFEIWNGGLGIYGGIIGGCLGILLVCKVKKLSWRKLFDMIGPGVMIAQAIGRWGNFFNGEAYGYPIGDTTRYFFFLKEFELPSGEGTFFNLFRMGLYPNDYSHYYMVNVHPTFLYESIWNVLGFILINLFYKRKKFDGQIALMYFTWYGFGRMFIEGLRTDSLYILKGVASDSGLRISQCVGLICFVVGLSMLIAFGYRFRAKRPLSEIVTVREVPVRRVSADGTVYEEPAESFVINPVPASEEESDAAEEADEAEEAETDDASEENDTTDSPKETSESEEEDENNGTEN